MANYLLLRPSGWYFRYTIPRRYAHLVNVRELRYSLSTALLNAAKKISKVVSVTVDKYLFKGLKGLLSVTDQRLKEIVKAAIEDAKDFVVSEHTERKVPLNSDSREKALELYDSFVGDYREALAYSDYRIVEKQVSDLLSNNGFTVDKTSGTFKQTCRDYIGGLLSVLELHQDLLNGATVNDSPKINSLTHHKESAKGSGLPISFHLEEFLSDRKFTRKTQDNSLGPVHTN